jgi:hypothetical protein
MQATSQHNKATVRGSSNTRAFKYVTAKKTRRKTVDTAVVRVSAARSKTYFARCDTAAEAASMVVEYLNTRLNTIRVNRAQRHAPEESADILADLSDLFEGWVPADLTNAVIFRGQASSMQMSGPTAYVASLLGK